jgi:hypothetical protein
VTDNRISARLSDEAVERLDRLAAERRMTRTDVLRGLIEGASDTPGAASADHEQERSDDVGRQQAQDDDGGAEGDRAGERRAAPAAARRSP